MARYTAAGFDWRSLPRLPLRGYGQVVEIRKIENPKGPQAVNVANWTEGGDALAVAFGKMLGPYFEAMGKATQENMCPADNVCNGDDPAGESTAKGKRKASINARMIDTLQKQPEAKDWTIEQWMQHLGCKSKASVAKTKCWETIMGARAVRKVQRLQQDQKRTR